MNKNRGVDRQIEGERLEMQNRNVDPKLIKTFFTQFLYCFVFAFVSRNISALKRRGLSPFFNKTNGQISVSADLYSFFYEIDILQ